MKKLTRDILLIVTALRESEHLVSDLISLELYFVTVFLLTRYFEKVTLLLMIVNVTWFLKLPSFAISVVSFLSKILVTSQSA